MQTRKKSLWISMQEEQTIEWTHDNPMDGQTKQLRNGGNATGRSTRSKPNPNRQRYGKAKRGKATMEDKSASQKNGKAGNQTKRTRTNHTRRHAYKKTIQADNYTRAPCNQASKASNVIQTMRHGINFVQKDPRYRNSGCNLLPWVFLLL